MRVEWSAIVKNWEEKRPREDTRGRLALVGYRVTNSSEPAEQTLSLFCPLTD